MGLRRFATLPLPSRKQILALVFLGSLATACKTLPENPAPMHAHQAPGATSTEWNKFDSIRHLARNDQIHIIYNNDQFGYIEPCGCRVDPIGGMYRRWNATALVPASARISVDAGNLFFVSPLPPANLVPQWREQAKGIIEAYNQLGWDIVAPGENDFALGVSELVALQKSAKFQFLSSNIVWEKDGRTLFRENLVLERLGRKIGFFSIYSPALTVPAELKVNDPVTTAREQLKKLRRAGADFIVALTHQGLPADEALAKEIGEIDLIVGSHSQSFLQNPRYEGKTAIVQLSSKGQVFGALDLKESDGKLKVAESVVVDLDARFDPVPEGKINPLKGLVAAQNLRIAELHRAQSAKLWEGQARNAHRFETFVQCTTCHSEQAKFQSRLPHAAAFLTLVAAQKEQELNCLGCHSVGLRQEGGFENLPEAILTKSGKFIRYENVLQEAKLTKLRGEKVSYRANPERVKQDVSAWHRALERKGAHRVFVGVQCENCHGALPSHPFGEATKPKKITYVTCLQCHTAEQMPRWYDASGKPLQPIIETAIQSIRCPSMKK